MKIRTANGRQMVPTPAGGIYYALPKTIFKVRLVLEQIDQVPGPFADYATKYLGTTNYIRSKKVYYRLLSVKVEPVTVADPTEVFYVRFPENRSSKEIRSFGLRLNNQGILTGFGPALASSSSQPVVKPASSQMYLFSDFRKNFDMQAEYVRAQKIDTIVRKITIDTVTIKRFLFRTTWVNLTEDERANDAAKQIKNIRVSRLRYMDEELQKLEHEYLVLFLGREYRQMVVRTYVFDPEKQMLSGKIFQYTDENGNTKTLNITARVVNTMKLVPQKKIAVPDALFYRIPVKVVISVGSGQHPFYSDTFEVPQLGVVTTVPVRPYTSLQFSPQTGALLDIVKK